ncbi:hypothetical protein H0H92_001147 [Tricholoma furcatifolium]|nr:hypothetical protein H0H92_001147 [Tricholoma furcatifolium]
MAYCRHLENHKDLRHLKSLLVHNEWTNLYRVQHWDDPMSVLENGHFFTPLLRSVRQIIMASGSLTSLSISYLKLSYNLLISICDLPNLNVFSLFFCKLSKKFQRVLDKGIRSNSIRNLEIYATDDTYLRCLCLTSVCLNLYNLCIESALPPPESIWDKCYFLPSLKYLYLGRTSPSKLPVFVDWFRRALDGTPLALTRLKIEFEHGVPDAELIAFLQALNDAPLEILSVYGVSQVDGRLVEAIAEYFSHLLGLTIHRRNSRPNTRVKRVTWPLPVSNYLRQLSAFSRLRHFGWNNSAFPVQIFTPYFMQVFENQAFDEPDLACRDIDSEWLSNAKELTVLFGIHCPTLCSVSWVDEDDFRIIRSDEGVIRAEVWDLGLPYDNPWDPCRPWVAPFN